MFRQLIAAAAFALVAGTAWAACSNYRDGNMSDGIAPRATLCFQGKCETAKLMIGCGGLYSQNLEWSNGWRVDYTFKEEAGEFVVDDSYATVHGKRYPVDALTCTPIDKWGCVSG